MDPRNATEDRSVEGVGPHAPVPARILLHLAGGAVLGTAAGYLYGLLVPTAFIDAVHAGFHLGWLAGLATWAVSTRRRRGERELTFGESAALGGILLGGVGLVLGFFGPMILTPDANQGPLLGIFFTGPLGFVLGAAGGGVLHLLRRKSR